MKKLKLSLILSLVFNLFFLLVGSAYFIKKTITPVSHGTPFHDIKKSEFSILPSSKNSIVFAGDSITNYADWNELLQNNNVKNRGIPGDKTAGLLDNIDNITVNRPQKIFLMIGINDLSNGLPVDSTLINYEKIIEGIKNKAPDTKLIIQSVLPINTNILQNTKATNDEINQFNKGIKDLATKNNLQYINLYSSFVDKNGQLEQNLTIDGIHLSGEGYLLWKSLIQDYVD